MNLYEKSEMATFSLQNPGNFRCGRACVSEGGSRKEVAEPLIWGHDGRGVQIAGHRDPETPLFCG